MERLMLGTGIRTSASLSGSSSFCVFSVFVKKGHEECGDSAFIYCDEKKAILGVFDGVSGEAGAASASSKAAEAVLAYLKKIEKCDEEKMRDAIARAGDAIETGFTTALVLFVQKDGSFVICSVGDSPAYGMDVDGTIALELPAARAVADKDSIFKFLQFRNLVTSILGPGGGEAKLHMRKGRLRKGEIFILATDGLSDNLWLKVSEGYVTDSSGSDDLKSLMGKEKNPEKIIKKINKEIEKRMKAGRKESKNAILEPKKDDIALAVVSFK